MTVMLFRRGVAIEEVGVTYQIADDSIITGDSNSGGAAGIPAASAPQASASRSDAPQATPAPLKLTFPSVCIIPCVVAHTEASQATINTLCDPTFEYLTNINHCIACAEVSNNTAVNKELLKTEIIHPHFAFYIDTCARKELGTSSYNPIPTPINTAALESVWLSLSSVASEKGYTPASTDIVIRTTVTTVLPTTLPGGAVSSVTTTYTTMIPNPQYFSSSTSPTASSPTTASPESSSVGTSSAWIAGPVVGGVVGMLLIAAACAFFILRSRRQRQPNGPAMEEPTFNKPEDGTFGKAQLHADSAAPCPPSELQDDGTNWAGKTPSSVNQEPVELPAHGVGEGPEKLKGT
ncbi:hypothetical protein QBC39DRAFT_434688 [Podospora conica]|nr:hypothetical protein QBC39DRAFT_434688 [Schizothecium conicum]